MIYKTSKELRRIFDLNREDMKYLSDSEHGVLKPKTFKQGIAAHYSETDIERLLDIKIYLLSGYKNPDMRRIFTDNYDSDEEIAEQIKIYKRRILMLEFFQKIRANMKDARNLSPDQSVEVIVTTAEALNTHGFEVRTFDDLYELFLDMIELVFIIDYLSRKESIKDENKIRSLNRSKEAFDLLIKYSPLMGRNINREELTEKLIEMSDDPEDSDQDIKDLAKEIVLKPSNKIRTIKRIMRKSWDQYINEWDVQTRENFRERMIILYSFVFDYFADEDTIFCLLKNIANFVRGLDRAALERGEVKILKRLEKDLFA